MPRSSSMPAIASLSCSVKSTPLVCAPSRNVVSNKYRRSRLTALSPIAEIAQRKGGGDEEDYQLDGDVIQPMAREWRVRLFHDVGPFPASCFFMVVLAIHSLPARTVLRCCAAKPCF